MTYTLINAVWLAMEWNRKDRLNGIDHTWIAYHVKFDRYDVIKTSEIRPYVKPVCIFPLEVSC